MDIRQCALEGLVIFMNPDFFKSKKILITGHTGFKGSWLTRILINLGAEITGYSLEPSTDLNLFSVSDLEGRIKSVIGDIRDYEKLKKVFDESAPEIVFHLAAQPLVRESYDDPKYTYETNVLGTVNILECIRTGNSVKSFLNVTTDKVYKNNEWEWGYRETDVIDGHDPYSNSKSCSELVTGSYINSFFSGKDISISTARAGNVIGGGDFAKDRIIPDCVRAAIEGKKINVRNPYSTRPFQHVLEPLFIYLEITEKQYENKELQGCYNIGPDDSGCISTGSLVDIFCKKWGEGQEWCFTKVEGPHEAGFLKLDCSRIKNVFGWKPFWSIETAVEKTVDWWKVYLNKGNIVELMNKQIDEYFKVGEINV